MTTRRATVTVARWATAAVLGLLVLLLGGSTVLAHTEFESSDPADGATVDGPLDLVVLNFTDPAVESGDGFVLRTPDGVTRRPTSVETTDGTRFEVAFDPPLEIGTHGFRWEVQAGDAHPINGAFRFEVVGTAMSTSSTPASVATTAEAADDPTGSSTAPGAADPTGSATVLDPPETAESTLEEFLDVDGQPEPFAGRLGRTLSIGGSVFAIGVLASLQWVVRGSGAEIGGLLQWTRLAGVALAAGGLIELAALDEVTGGPLREELTSKAGVAAAFDVVGGVLIVIGFSRAAGRLVAARPRPLSADVAILPTDAGTEADGRTIDALRWRPDRTAAVGLAGIVLAIAAYWFDGHTVTRGPWAVHAAVNLVHVASAGVWAGGVFAITLLVVGRRRRGVQGGVVGFIVRFSSIAAVSLALVALAGVALTWIVIDGPGDVFSTSWGRILLAKVTAVAVAASLGAYNHFSLRPALERHPDDDVLGAHLRTSLLVESAILAVVIVLTAVLVAASL